MAVGISEARFNPLIRHERGVLIELDSFGLERGNRVVNVVALKEDFRAAVVRRRRFAFDLDRERGVATGNREASVARGRVDELRQAERSIERLRALDVGHEQRDVIELHVSVQ
jgi:hypothetical protein